MKYKKYVYLSIAAIAIIITVLYYYFNYVKPVRFINHYLCVRYDGTNEENIGEKVAIQQKLFSNSLLNTGFKFTNFSNDIEIVRSKNMETNIVEKDIYGCKLKNNRVYVKANVVTEQHSIILGDKHLISYDLEFMLKRKALGYLIEYIKVHNIIVEAIDSGKFENSNNHVQ